MKDIRIKGTRIRKELKIWAALIFTAFLINLYAILIHDGEWIELVTQLHIVLMLSFILYLLIVLLRGFFKVIGKIFIPKEKSTRSYPELFV